MAYNYYNGYYPQYNGAVPDMLNQYKGQYQQPVPIPQPTSSSDVLWVLNENEATSYPVAPNNSVVLWDKNEPTIYVKSVNAQGIPSMRILDFKERTGAKAEPEHQCKCGDRFVTKEQFEELQAEVIALSERIELKDIKSKKTKEID